MGPDKLPQQKFLFSRPIPGDKPHPLAEYKKKRGHKMSESKPNTNQRHAGTLFYRNAPHMESLVFAPPKVAEYISAIHHALEATTWGEFKARMPPEEYRRLLKKVRMGLRDLDDDDRKRRKLPSDDDPFHPNFWFPEWCDGDYPDWLQARQAEWLPKSILKHFARHETSVLNGDFWMIDPVF